MFQNFHKLLLLTISIIMIFSVVSCTEGSDELKDGYYTAELAEYDEFGWKEFITIYVSKNKILTVDYNARNESGLIRSWDMNYMRLMNESDGTYPNEYTRVYAESLIDKQSLNGIDAIAGATHSYTTFYRLVEAVINHAKNGDKSIAYVEIY